MDSEYMVVVNKAGEQFKYVTDEKRALTDDSKEFEEKLGASEDGGVKTKTVGGAGEIVFKDEEKEEKDLEEVPEADEEKANKEGAAENEATEDSEEKLRASEDDGVRIVGGAGETVFKDEEKKERDLEEVPAVEQEKGDEEYKILKCQEKLSDLKLTE